MKTDCWQAYYQDMAAALMKSGEPELSRLLRLLADHIGRDKAISVEDLSNNIWICRSERTVRKNIRRLRYEYGVPIAANSRTTGRWIATEKDGILHTAGELRSRAARELQLARVLESISFDLDGNRWKQGLLTYEQPQDN